MKRGFIKALGVAAATVLTALPSYSEDVWFDAGIKDYGSWPASNVGVLVIEGVGTWNGTAGGELVGEAGAKALQVSSTVDRPLSFTVDNPKTVTSDIVTIRTTARMSILDADEEMVLPPASSKCALTCARLDEETTAYFGFAKDPAGDTNVWAQLSGAVPAGESVELVFDIKEENGSKFVRYTVEGTALTLDGSEWIEVAFPDEATAGEVSSVLYSGDGEVASLAGFTEKTIPRVALTIPEAEHVKVASVKANGVLVEELDGGYQVPQGAVVVVRFEPEDGYALTKSSLRLVMGAEGRAVSADEMPSVISISSYITINEIMASNGSSLTTKNGTAGVDWVELYNSNDSDIDLAGWYLGNDPTKKISKWTDFQIQGSCVVPAHGYKIVWFDGDGLCTSWAADEAHVSANISTTANKHTVFLADANGEIAEQVKMPGQMKDVSFGLGHASRTLVAKDGWTEYRTGDGEWARVRGPVGKSAGPADFVTTSAPAQGGLTTFTVEGSVRIPREGVWSFAVDSDVAFEFALSNAEKSFTIENDSTGAALQQMSAFSLDARAYTFRLVYTGAADCTQPKVWVAEGDFTTDDSAGFNESDFAAIGLRAGEGALEHGGLFEGRLAAAVDAESFEWRTGFTLDDPPADGDELTLDLETVGTATVKLNGTVCDPSAIDLALIKAGANTLEISVTAEAGEAFLSADLAFASQGNAFVYFREPTPGRANGIRSYGQMTPEVVFSEVHGYKTAPFALTLECPAAPSEQIYYTLDGTSPTEASTPYTGAIEISKTTCIRAAVLREDTILQKDCAATYIFLDDVLAQQQNVVPEGFPASGAVNGHAMRYGMNQSVVNGEERDRLIRGFGSIATFSIVIDPKNLFDKSTGIYVNPSGDGRGWERQMMLEQINPNGDDAGFSIPAGIRIRGAASRSKSFAKHSLRFFFRGEYGAGSLEYPLFGNEGADEFDKVDLRTSQNYSWSNENNDQDTFIHECFSRDSQGAMGEHYTRSRYYNLFINGQYWGLYMTQERGDTDFAETYNGGAADNYDLIKTSSANGGYVTGVNEGTKDAWDALRNLAIEGFDGEHEANYFKAMGLNPDGSRNPAYPVLLNPTNLMVFIISAHYACDGDSPNSVWGGFPNNLYALRDRVDGNSKADGFFFLRHDSEHSLGLKSSYAASYSQYNHDPTKYGVTGNMDFGHFNPAELHFRLCKNPDYRRTFADVFYKHCLRAGGAMTAPVARSRFEKRMSEIDDAIVGECARWSTDVKNRNRAKWLSVCNNNCIAGFIEKRMPEMVRQYRAQGWYPSIDAAKAVDANGMVLADGAQVAAADRLYLTGGEQGKVYYTTDGSDPWLMNGTLNPSAREYTGGSPVPETVVAFDKGAEWKYFDAGSKPADDWMAEDYDDAVWKSGKGKLGFAGSGTFGTKLDKYVGGGNSGTQVNAFYFRKTIELDAVASALTSLRASISCDDGYVLYINGQEVKRENLPAETIEYSTSAGTNMDDHDFDLSFAAGLLKPGRNVIAAEVHQCNGTSSDAWWDLALSYEKAVASGDGLEVPPEGMTLTMRVLSDAGEWSAIDSISVKGEMPKAKPAEALRVAEIMSSSASGKDTDDYLVLKNIAEGEVSLDGVKIVAWNVKKSDESKPSLTYAFGDGQSILPGESLKLTNLDKLTNSQVGLRIYDADGALVQDVYVDAGWWNSACDETGASFVAKTFGAEAKTHADWKPSATAWSANLRVLELYTSTAGDGGDTGEYIVLTNLEAETAFDLTDVKIVAWNAKKKSEADPSLVLTLADLTIPAGGTLTLDQATYFGDGKFANSKVGLKIYDPAGDCAQEVLVDADWWNKACDGTGASFLALEFGSLVNTDSQWTCKLPAPRDWPEDPDAEITEETKPSDLGITEGAFAEATTDELKKLAKWAKAKEVVFGGEAVNAMAFDEKGNPATVFEEAYLLNCAPTAEAVAEAKSEFKFDAIVPGEVPSIEGAFNGTVKVLGSATLGPDADWTANNKDARFYKAVLTR